MSSFGSKIGYFVRQRSFQVALALWVVISVAAVALCHGTMPLPIRAASGRARGDGYLEFDRADIFGAGGGTSRADSRGGGRCRIWRRVRRSVELLCARQWAYGFMARWCCWLGGLWDFIILARESRCVLNGSLVGATRVQSPAEVYTWAAFNGILLALIPYVVFRMRGYSNQQLNLRSSNLKSDVIVIAVVLAIGCFMDFALNGNFLRLTHHQQIVGGLMSFVLHLFGTDLPVMIFIYSILMPRYAKLTAPVTAFLLGAASYPAIHVFEAWTRYDSVEHSLL